MDTPVANTLCITKRAHTALQQGEREREREREGERQRESMLIQCFVYRLWLYIWPNVGPANRISVVVLQIVPVQYEPKTPVQMMTQQVTRRETGERQSHRKKKPNAILKIYPSQF